MGGRASEHKREKPTHFEAWPLIRAHDSGCEKKRAARVPGEARAALFRAESRLGRPIIIVVLILRPLTQMSHKKRARAGKLCARCAPTHHAAVEWSLRCHGAALAGHYYSL